MPAERPLGLLRCEVGQACITCLAAASTVAMLAGDAAGRLHRLTLHPFRRGAYD